MPRKGGEVEGGTIELRRLKDAHVDVEIEGMTPVIPHKWSEKSKRMMPGHPDALEIDEKRGPHDPEGEAEACVYRLEDGRPGLPAVAFKAAMVGACRLFEGITMVEAKLKFYVVGEGPEQLVPIEGLRHLREDTPRNSNGSADLRYRYMFYPWRTTLRVSYLPSAISHESILALIDAAGRCGVGDWRPSAPKSATGTFGQFRVVAEEEASGEGTVG